MPKPCYLWYKDDTQCGRRAEEYTDGCDHERCLKLVGLNKQNHGCPNDANYNNVVNGNAYQ